MPCCRNPPIRVSCRVSGRHGELEDPPPSSGDNTKKRKRRRKKLLFDQVVYSVGQICTEYCGMMVGILTVSQLPSSTREKAHHYLSESVEEVGYWVLQMNQFHHLKELECIHHHL